MGAFLQSSRQCFASYRGKLMGEVTGVVVASCGGTNFGDEALRTFGSFAIFIENYSQLQPQS